MAITGSLTFAIAARGAAAQASGDIGRPKVPPAPPFVFPKVQERSLDNGLRILIVEDHSLPLVAVRAIVHADSTDDPPGKAGLFAVTMGMLREGTETMTADEAAAAVARLGSNVTPTRFTTTIANFDASLELMASMLTRPTLSPTPFERRKTQQAAAVARSLQIAATTPRRVFYGALLGRDHPLARSVASTPASVNALTLDDVTAFYAKYLHPELVTVVIVGDITAANAASTVSKHFGRWARGQTLVDRTAAGGPSPRPTTIYLLDRPQAAQAYIFAGQLGPSRDVEESYALEAMAPILGTGVSSRLQRNLRDQRSYMYSGTLLALSWAQRNAPTMIFGAGQFNPAKIDSALIEWVGELRAIRSQTPPTDAELSRVRAALLATLPIQLQTDDAMADRLATMMQGGLPFDYYDRLARRLGTLTGADVAAAASKYLDPDHLTIVVAGDRQVIEPLLRRANLAPIVIVDDSGNPVPAEGRP